MTVSTTTSSVTYTADGSTAAFIIPFPYTDATQIAVRVRSPDNSVITRMQLGIDFTVGSVGVTFILADPPATYLVDIVRWVNPVQNTAYLNLGPFPAAAHEAALDYLTLLAQQLINAGGGNDPFAYAGLPTGAPPIPAGSVTQEQLSLVGNAPVVMNAPLIESRLAFGRETNAIGGSFIINQPNSSDGNRGTAQGIVQVIGDIAALATYASRDNVALFTAANAAARFGDSGSDGVTTYTGTAVASTGWTVDLSRVQIGMLIDTTHATKYTGEVTAVNASTGTITVSGWYLQGGGLATPANGKLAILAPVTKIWGHDTNTVFYSYSDSITTQSVGHEIGFQSASTHVTFAAGIDCVQLNTDFGTGGTLGGLVNPTHSTAHVARGIWESGFQSQGPTLAGFYTTAMIAGDASRHSPTYGILDDSDSTAAVRVSGGTHTYFLQFLDNAGTPAAVCSIDFAGNILTIGNITSSAGNLSIAGTALVTGLITATAGLTTANNVIGKFRNVATNAGTPTGGTSGDIVWDTTAKKLWYNDNGTWKGAAFT